MFPPPDDDQPTERVTPPPPPAPGAGYRPPGNAPPPAPPPPRPAYTPPAPPNSTTPPVPPPPAPAAYTPTPVSPLPATRSSDDPDPEHRIVLWVGGLKLTIDVLMLSAGFLLTVFIMVGAFWVILAAGTSQNDVASFSILAGLIAAWVAALSSNRGRRS